MSGQQPSHPSDYDDELFDRSRAEVQLLLEFVAGRADTSYRPGPAASAEDRAAFDATFKRVAEICYGPPIPYQERPAAAAVLLAERDRLSRLAYPARSLTIAYSSMFAGVVRLPPFRNRISSLLRRVVYDGTVTPSDAAASDQRHRTLITLSTRAWPGLVANVRWFRYWSWLSGLAMMFWLLVTAATYWDTAYGRTLLDHIDAAEKEIATLASAKAPANAVVCKDAARATEPDCIRYGNATQAAATARADLHRFASCDGPLCHLHVFHWGVVLCGYDKAIAMIEDETKIEHTIAPIVAVFGGFVLPMMFGYLGTSTSAFRTVRDRMRDSTLAPQDFVMVLMSVPLGIIAGVAVGLFYTLPSPSTTSSGGGGTNLTLTVSGLAFLAGYAAEAFFKVLDNLPERLFRQPQAPATPPPRSGAV